MARSGKSPAQSTAQGDEMGQSRPPLTEDLLKRLYANMLKCRMVQEQLRLAGASPSTAGLEATIVGATIDLRSEDAIAPSRNSLFAHVIHGTPLQYVFLRAPAVRRNNPWNRQTHNGALISSRGLPRV
jgi:TPP-dependent pyruvate/acetoin dehydrogenase alpha subunit